MSKTSHTTVSESMQKVPNSGRLYRGRSGQLSKLRMPCYCAKAYYNSANKEWGRSPQQSNWTIILQHPNLRDEHGPDRLWWSNPYYYLGNGKDFHLSPSKPFGNVSRGIFSRPTTPSSPDFRSFTRHYAQVRVIQPSVTRTRSLYDGCRSMLQRLDRSESLATIFICRGRHTLSPSRLSPWSRQQKNESMEWVEGNHCS